MMRSAHREARLSWNTSNNTPSGACDTCSANCPALISDLCSMPKRARRFPGRRQQGKLAKRVAARARWATARGLVVLPLRVFADVNNAPAVQRMKHAASPRSARRARRRPRPGGAAARLRVAAGGARDVHPGSAPTRRLAVGLRRRVGRRVSAKTPVVREAIVLGGRRGGRRHRREVAEELPTSAALPARIGLGEACPAAAVRRRRGRLDARRRSGRSTAGEFAANAKAGELSPTPARRSPRAPPSAPPQRRAAPADAALAAAAPSDDGAPDCVGVVGERDEKGRVRNVVGRVGRVGRAAVDGIKAEPPRVRQARLDARRARARARARTKPEGARLPRGVPKRKTHTQEGSSCPARPVLAAAEERIALPGDDARTSA